MDTNNSNVKAQLDAWRASSLHEMVVPSGLPVTVKQASIMDIVSHGRIPDTLTGVVNKMLEGESDAASGMTITAEELPEMIGLFDMVVRACVVSPPIANEPSDTHLGINEIPFDDKEAIFSWANGEASALTSFRDESGQPDPVTPAGENVRPSSE